MKDSLELEVKFTKIGNKVKYQLPTKMFCEQKGNEIPNTMTLNKTDNLIKVWLGDVDKLFKSRNVVFKKVNINQAYDKCDRPFSN